MRENRKTASVLLLLILVLAIGAQQPEASAHFTLGRLTGTPRFHDQDFDPHVAGPTAYLWPGSGYAAITGASTGLPPGYQSPWPGGNPHSAPSSWYQLEGNAYSPFGAILTSTPAHSNLGDLILGINFTEPALVIPPGMDLFYSGLSIYIPPDFKNILTSQVVTSITNDYSEISVNVASATDPFAPGWTRVDISSSTDGFIMAFRASHGYQEWYYVRLNGVVAPEIAGKYFLKILLRMTGSSAYSYPSTSDPPSISNVYMPVQNWPVLLVKGEVDPAIIYGTVRYGAWNSTLYNQPVPTSGMVRAVGRALDPYTDALTSRPVEARGFFNESAQGHYEIEGVAPGIYDVYASAAGFPEQLISSNVQVLKAQSLELNGYLNPGPVISGRVFSKSGFGEVAWTGLKPIRIEIYATDTYTAGNIVSYSPTNLTGGAWGLFTYGNVSGMSYSWTPGSSPLPTRVGLTWESGLSYYSDGAMFSLSGSTCGGSPDPCGVPDGVGPAQFWWVDSKGAFTNGGGPASFVFHFGSRGIFGAPANMSGYVPQALATWVNGLEAGRYFVRAFVNGYVQSTLDGQSFMEYPFAVSAHDWAGDVFLPIDLYATGAVNVTVHLHDRPDTLKPSPTGRPNSLLVELYDGDGNLVAMNFSAIAVGTSSPSVLLTGLGLEGSNPNRRFALYAYRGFGYQDYGIPPGIYHMKAYVEGYLQKNDELVEVGMGLGVANVSLNLYHGASFQVTVYSTDSERPTVLRNWNWPGEGIAIRIYNSTGTLIDAQSFLSQQAGKAWVGPFRFDGSNAIIAQPMAEFLALFGAKPTAYSNGTYTFRVSTYGYVQPSLTEASGIDGNMTTDFRINLLIGANLTLDVKFKTEEILSIVPYNMSMRVRLFNDVGDLVGAWITGSADDVLNAAQLEAGLRQDPVNLAMVESIDPVHRMAPLVWYVPSGTADLKVTIAGIPSYSDPIFQGTFAQGIKGGPLYEGSWTFEVDTVNWYEPLIFYPSVPGLLQGESFHIIQNEPYVYGWTSDSLSANHLGPYSQRDPWIVQNTSIDTEISTIHSLNLNGYLQGRILAQTWSDEERSASWIRIQAAKNNDISLVSYSLDGFYDMYLLEGKYSLGVTEWTALGEGHKLIDSMQVTVSSGQKGEVNLVLQDSAIPLSESSSVLLFSLLLVMSLLALSTRKNTITGGPVIARARKHRTRRENQ